MQYYSIKLLKTIFIYNILFSKYKKKVQTQFPFYFIFLIPCVHTFVSTVPTMCLVCTSACIQLSQLLQQVSSSSTIKENILLQVLGVQGNYLKEFNDKDTNPWLYAGAVYSLHQNQIWSIVTSSVNWFLTYMEAFFTTFIIWNHWTGYNPLLMPVDLSGINRTVPSKKMHISLSLFHLQPWGHKRFKQSSSPSSHSNTWKIILHHITIIIS